MDRRWSAELFAIPVSLVLIAAIGCDANHAGAAGAGSKEESPEVSVKTVSPVRTVLRRITTQPAAVHPYYQAEIFAKVAGYLGKLQVDLGDEVEAGELLAEIEVPEMSKQFERHQATVRQLQAEERKAQAGIVVAEAAVQSAEADWAQAQAEVQRAEAQLVADRVESKRISELVAAKAVADRLLDEAQKRYESAAAARAAAVAASESAEAGVGVARARLGAAQADLAAAEAATAIANKQLEELQTLMDYATLKAPFRGRIVQRRVDPGDLVRNIQTTGGNVGEPLFTIAQCDKVRVRVPVPERDAPWVNVGDEASVQFQAIPGQSFAGKVSRAAGSLDEKTRTLLVEIDLLNQDLRLLPGMFGEAAIVLDERPDSLVLPASAVRYDEAGHSFVYAVQENNEIAVLDVTTGLDDGKQIEITGGLDGGERVVAAMIQRLKAGDKVRIEP